MTGREEIGRQVGRKGRKAKRKKKKNKDERIDGGKGLKEILNACVGLKLINPQGKSWPGKRGKRGKRRKPKVPERATDRKR